MCPVTCLLVSSRFLTQITTECHQLNPSPNTLIKTVPTVPRATAFRNRWHGTRAHVHNYRHATWMRPKDPRPRPRALESLDQVLKPQKRVAGPRHTRARAYRIAPILAPGLALYSPWIAPLACVPVAGPVAELGGGPSRGAPRNSAWRLSIF